MLVSSGPILLNMCQCAMHAVGHVSHAGLLGGHTKPKNVSDVSLKLSCGIYTNKIMSVSSLYMCF